MNPNRSTRLYDRLRQCDPALARSRSDDALTVLAKTSSLAEERETKRRPD